MKLENQVVSLELAKQLEELNVEQSSLFYWCSCTHFVEGEMVTDWMLENKESMKVKGLDVGLTYSAFTVAELGELLPDTVEGHKWIEMGRYDGQQVVQYQKIGNELMPIRKEAETEADARAKMLIWLIKNKYLRVEEI